MALDASRIRGICFDVDGTLSDTDDQFVSRLNRWLLPFRFLFPKGDSLSFARRVIMASENPGTYLHGLPDRFGVDEKIRGIGDYFYRKGAKRSTSPFILVNGVEEMLDTLSHFYSLSIVSARSDDSVEIFLDQFKLKKFFQVIVTAHTCSRTKPHPSPILYAAQNMGLEPEACLMVGDTTVDVIAGKSAGAQTAGVLCGFGEEQELLDVGADLIVETTSDLLKYIII